MPKDDFLFAIGIFKAFMSSPEAAISSLNKRITKVAANNQNSGAYEDNLEVLNALREKAEKVIRTKHDTKYSKLKDTLIELGWSGRKHDDRYVIFAERIATLEYLSAHLQADFSLKEETIVFFHGGLPDTEQQQIIDDFGKEDSDIRLLLCSDAGSQGVNLHFFCNRMFNYDIPWSLITLEQRNGRIDRYGQKKTPFIYYIVAESDIDGLKTDLHIVERLTQKEEVVHRTLGDAGSVMKLYDTGKEEKFVEKALFRQNENFLDNGSNDADGFDFSTLFSDQDDKTEVTITDSPFEKPLSIYNNDNQFFRELFEQLSSGNQMQHNEVLLSDGYVEILNHKDLNQILYDLPIESKPPIGGQFKLTLDKDLVQRSIENARKRKGEWAEFQILYELHPVIKYYMTKLEASVNKDVALAAKSKIIPPGTYWYIFQGQVSNNHGQPVIADFFVVGLNNDGSIYRKPFSLSGFIDEFKLKSQLYTENITGSELDQLKEILPDAVQWATHHMIEGQQRLEGKMEIKMADYQAKIQKWHSEALAQLELDFSERAESNFWSRIKDSKQREIETILSESSQFYKDLTSLQGEAFLKILAVFYNS